MPHRHPRLRLLLITTVLAVALGGIQTGPVCGQPGPKERWLQIQTDHFEIYSNAPEGKTSEVADDLLALREAFSALGVRLETIRHTPLTLVLFKNQEALDPYLPRPAERGKITAYFVRTGPHRSYVLLNGMLRPDELRPIAYEAYSRFLIRAAYPGFPDWLRRGMADLYGTTTIDKKGRIRLGMPKARHLETIGRYQLMSLKHFLALNPDSLSDRHQRDLHRAQSWLIAHHLVIGGGPLAGAFFQGLLDGQGEEAALGSAFQMNLDAFSDRLGQYLHGATMPIVTHAIEGYQKPRAEVRSLALEEATYLLASYLVNSGGKAPAELVRDHLEALPDGFRPGDRAALGGQLALEAGDRDRAGTLFEQALAAGIRDAINGYNAARYWRDSASGLARDALERAVALDEGFTAAWSQLAMLYDPEQEGEALVEAATRALVLDPESEVLAYNLALAYLSQNDLDAAQSAVDRYLARPSMLRDRAQAAIAMRSGAAARAEHTELYNQAVSKANGGDREGACAALAALLAEPSLGPKLAKPARGIFDQLACSDQQPVPRYN